jgi:hypothetical protein
MLVSLPMILLDGADERTGGAWPFAGATGGLADPADSNVTRFTQDGAEELHDDQDDRCCPPLLQRPLCSKESKSDNDDSASNADQSAFENGQDVLLSEDCDNL